MAGSSTTLTGVACGQALIVAAAAAVLSIVALAVLFLGVASAGWRSIRARKRSDHSLPKNGRF